MSALRPWSPDRVSTLTELWLGGASASQIAHALGGVTRNAVIGKIHRLGLSGRGKPSAPGGPRAKPRPERRLRPVPLEQRSWRAASKGEERLVAEAGVATVLSVRHGECRWPIGDPLAEGFCLCGRPVVRGAYCAPHGALAYRPTARDHLLRFAGLR